MVITDQYFTAYSSNYLSQFKISQSTKHWVFWVPQLMTLIKSKSSKICPYKQQILLD